MVEALIEEHKERRELRFERAMAYSAWTDALISDGASDAVMAVVAEMEERGDSLAVG